MFQMDSRNLTDEHFAESSRHGEADGFRITIPSGTGRQVTILQPANVNNKRRLIIEEEEDSSPLQHQQPPPISTPNQQLLKKRTASLPTKPWTDYYRLRMGVLPPISACAMAEGKARLLGTVPVRQILESEAATKHFFTCGEDGSKTHCRATLESGQQCGESFQSTIGPSVLVSHLLSKHRDVYEAVIQFRKHQYTFLKFGSDSLTSSVEQASNFLSDIPPNNGEFRKLLVRMIADNLPSQAMIQSQAFKNLINLLNPKYEVPSCMTIRSDLNNLRLEIVSKIDNLLRHCKYGSFTAESWTSRRNRKFLGITFHWISPKFESMDVVLAVNAIGKQVSTDTLRENIYWILNRPALRNKIFGGTTDRKANFKSALASVSKSMGFEWLACAAHSIQLSVEAALNTTCAADKVIEKCHQIAVVVNSSSLISRYLEITQKENNPTSPSLKFPTDLSPQWFSQYLAVESAVKLADTSKATMENISINDFTPNAIREARTLTNAMLDADDLLLAKDVLTVLQPLYTLTALIRSSKAPLISQLYPRLWEIHNEEGNTAQILKTDAGRRLHEKLRHIRGRRHVERIPDVAAIATYLNPGAKNHKIFEIQVERNGKLTILYIHVQHLIMEKLLEMYKNAKSSQGSSGEPWFEVDSSDDEQSNVSSSSEVTLPKNIERELEMYNKYTLVGDRRTKYFNDPLAWWRKHNNYRYLPFLVRQYLSIQVSSAPSERLFCDADEMMSREGSDWDEITMENLLYIRGAHFADEIDE